jgi:protein-disulfide isomerase
MHDRSPRTRTLKAAKPLVAAFAAFAACADIAATPSAADVAQPAADSQVARIDGKPIPYAELSARVNDKLVQQQRDYDAQLHRLALGAARARSNDVESELNKLIDEHVLALEAAARKTTAAELLKALKTPAPTDADLHAFYNQHRAEVNHQAFEAVKPDIEEYLRGEAAEEARLRYLQTLRKKYHVVSLWEPLREQVDATGPQRGPANARITIVEFSDFQCPFCGRLAPILKQLQDAYPADIRLIFRNLPLRTIHPQAAASAQAGVCAGAQGKFWEMHDAMYADQNSLGANALSQKAQRLGLDLKQFNDCMTSEQGSAAIKADEEAGERLGLTGTPGSFVNGRFVDGALPLYQWQALVDDELSRAAAR